MKEILMQKVANYLKDSAIKNGPKEKTFLGNKTMPEELKKLIIDGKKK